MTSQATKLLPANANQATAHNTRTMCGGPGHYDSAGREVSETPPRHRNCRHEEADQVRPHGIYQAQEVANQRSPEVAVFIIQKPDLNAGDPLARRGPIERFEQDVIQQAEHAQPYRN